MKELKLEIRDIIKDSKGTYNTVHMLKIVKEYIRLRKDREIDIIYNGHPLEAEMLIIAFDHAVSWITLNYEL